ncbi:glyoxalase superfamily protein [Tianweitania sediminis]|uniref:Bleomycin resistance protein n=1 Tax=Tianweitania sediminis TaxID=1502156 RepID=A0A8J7UK59_9HYPH|nr:glyoxalase superfamily protein [Tianweitania sediminis]MBP0439349.1 VOC family protein [Tianweitania sediminis]
MPLGDVTPILRIFDIAKARAFYIDYLGFDEAWEHRFGENFPLYMAVRRGTCELHLSEHHGDATPGSACRIRVQDAMRLHAELNAKNYAFVRPGLETPPWGGKQVTVLDPFGNRLVFFEPDG